MLKPKCLGESDRVQGFAYSATGWLYPCCHTDNHHNAPVFEVLGMLDDHLRVENVDDIETILESEEWAAFRSLLVEYPNQAPPACWKTCKA